MKRWFIHVAELDCILSASNTVFKMAHQRSGSKNRGQTTNCNNKAVLMASAVDGTLSEPLCGL
jgi:hypothetical protein